jgi:hypothetical protein
MEVKFKELSKEYLEGLKEEFKNMPEDELGCKVSCPDLPKDLYANGDNIIIERYYDINPDASGLNPGRCIWYNKKVFDHFKVEY